MINKDWYKTIVIEANKLARAGKSRRKSKMKDIETFGTELEPSNFITSYSDPETVGGEEQQLNKNTNYDFHQFTDLGSGIFTMCGRTLAKLPAGVYTVAIPQSGIPHYINKDIKSDEWLEFKDSAIQKVLNEIDKFWASQDKFKKYGVLHRRGYLLYGPPGSGKTVLIKQIMAKIISNDGLVFFCNSSPSLVVKGIEFYRKLEPNRPIVVVLEDIDAIIRYHGEEQILAYLDGEDSSDNIFTIASTNYPEKLDKRIVQRPRRFDKITKIGLPDENMRKYYFSKKLGLEDDELDKWVKATKNFSFAAMTEMLISVKCLDMDFEEARARIDGMLNSLPDSKEYEKDLKEACGQTCVLGFIN